MKYSAVIASAGLSSRMHDFKPMLMLGNRTVLEHVIENFRGAECDTIAVVVGYKADTIKGRLHGRDLLLCENSEYAHTTMLDSLKIGIACITKAAEYDYLFLTPGDVPLIQPATIRAMKEYAERGAGIVRPIAEGKPGHPVLLRRDLVKQLQDYRGPDGLRGFLAEHTDAEFDVRVNDTGVLLDADTEEDFRRLVKMEDALPQNYD